MNTLLIIVNVVLFIMVTFMLVQKYRQSQEAGFLWLALPLVLLPFLGLFITEWIKISVDQLAAGEPDPGFPFSLVARGRITLGTLLSIFNGVNHVIWSASVLLSILLFGRRHRPEQKA